VFSSAVTTACRAATSGAIGVAMKLVGPATHVLFTVSYDMRLKTPHGRHRMVFRYSSSAAAREIGSDSEEGSVHGAAPDAEVAALPEHIVSTVRAALKESDEYRAPPSFRMHSTRSIVMGGGSGARTPAAAAAAAAAEEDEGAGMLDVAELFGAPITMPLYKSIAAALGGHVGEHMGTTRKKFWMLLPAVPPAHVTHHRGAKVAPTGAAAGAPAHAAATPLAAAAGAPGSAAAGAAVASDADADHAALVTTTMPVAIDSAIVVDDESTLRRLAHRMLTKIGLSVEMLEDGSELAAALKPDTGLVLLDIVMKRSDGVQVGVLCCINGAWDGVSPHRCPPGGFVPGIDAFSITQVCSSLRAGGATLPIIAMTGNVDPGSVELFRRVGFSGLLAKPFNEVRACAPVARTPHTGIIDSCELTGAGGRAAPARLPARGQERLVV
jgi:CheY-like chemotaxis protein